LFTSEKLSVQVHPDSRYARAKGLARGKDEAWIILDAEPGATLGIGLTRPLSKAELRAASRDGSIEALVDWRPVGAGDCFYSEAGTVHAIGAGVSLVEVQQNCDTTFRLYDYGRQRELQLDDALAVARTSAKAAAQQPREIEPGRSLIAGGPCFVIERWTQAGSGRLVARATQPLWLVPLAGSGEIDGRALRPGEVWIAEGNSELSLGTDSNLLVAYESPARERIWTQRRRQGNARRID